MTEDFDAFFNSAEHGTEAVYKTTSIVGIFENQYVEVNGVQSLKPTFLVNLTAVPNIKRGNSITIDNVVYKFMFKQDDGTGMTMLILEASN